MNRVPRVLVVDDDAGVRQLLETTLKLEGWLVETAGGGRQALKRASRPPWPDAILLDIMMPEVDGLSVLRALQASPLTAPIKVLLLSAKSDPLTIKLGEEAGAVDYITKPFATSDVVSRVLRALEPPQVAAASADGTF